jgi:hypothetical protein
MNKVAAWRKLPELRKQFKALRIQVQAIEDQLKGAERDAA